MSRAPSPADLKRAADTVLAARCWLNAAAEAARHDRPVEPMALEWLSDQLSDAVELIESPDTTGGGA